MFDNKFDDVFDDDFYHKHDNDKDDFLDKFNEKHFSHTVYSGPSVMELVIIFVCVVGALVLVSLLCRCCRGRTQGRVLAPPPDPNSTIISGNVPYPQQQYATVTVTAMPTMYPNSGQYPTAYPITTAYPAGHSPYPAAGAPYPTAGAPYPTAGAPYPAMPLPSSAPSAPDSNAMPPTYEQVVGKHPPYNPAYPQ